MRLALCHSALQNTFARGLIERLARNLDIVSLTIEADSSPAHEAWEQGAACDALLLILDSVSAPGPVKRQDWEGLLEHSGELPVAVLRLEDCQYPKLLERRRPFLAPESLLEAERWVERWLVRMLPEGSEGIGAAAIAAPVPEDWWAPMVDQPGVWTGSAADADSAQAFARAAGAHFQEVFWIGCAQRTPESIRHELEHWSRGAVRQLFILVHCDLAPESLPGGRHSYLVLAGQPAVAGQSDHELSPWLGACQASGFPGLMLDLMLAGRSRSEWASLVTVLDPGRGWYRPLGLFPTHREAQDRHLAILAETFRNRRARASECRELAGEVSAALRYGFQNNTAAAYELCLQFSLVLLDTNRNSEAAEWLRTLVEKSSLAGDEGMAGRARRELSWLVDDTGATLHSVPAPGEQLMFDFRDSFL